VTPRRSRADHHIQLLQGAQELFPALIADMDGARADIQLETYIFDCSHSGAEIAHALMRAAQRGVRVHLLVDGVGTGHLPAPWHEQLRAAGVQLHIYAQPGPLGLLLPIHWQRLHRKLCAIDGRILFCGGINILDDFYDPRYGSLSAPRLDFAVRVQGALVYHACEVMEQLWQRMQAVQHIRHLRHPQQLSLALNELRAARAATIEARHAEAAGRRMRATLVQRDNLRHRNRIERAYRRAIACARDDIIIANAYFIPGRKLRRALILAAQRGVRVRLLLQGRYENFMQYHAARPVYGALLAAGVEIYEYAPSFLHAKVAVIDAHGKRPWATVGSSNLDPLSLLLAREANIMVRNAAFAQTLYLRMEQAITHGSTPLDAQHYLQNRPWHVRALDRIAFGLMRAALWVTGQRY